MQSIGGGVVRFVGIEWLECPEAEPRDVVRECTRAGTIEILWDAAVMETFVVRVGDELRVHDGATIAANTMLFVQGWSRRLRADLPNDVKATVRFSEELLVAVDEVTGLSRPRFMPFALGTTEGDVVLDLLVGEDVVRSISIPRDGATPAVSDGDIVTRGTVLANVVADAGRRREPMSGIEALRDFLNAQRPFSHSYRAALSPCDGHVEAIEPRRVTLRDHAGKTHVVRRQRRSSMWKREGDEVYAGDALDSGERSHHDLLKIWGETRLFDHVLAELEIETLARRQPLAISRSYWILVVRAMLAWRRVLRPGDTGLRRHELLSRASFEKRQLETAARGGVPATYAPALCGLRTIAKRKLRAAHLSV